MRGKFRFGVFELDAEAGELRKSGTKIKLQEQPFQVLLALLERAGGIVTRQELQKKVWPAQTFVDFDHGLNNAIRRLREALGDSAENPHFIETLSRRGYRFIAPVTASNRVVAAQQTLNVAIAVRHRGRLQWWAIAVVVMVLSTSGFLAQKAFRMRNRVHANSGPQIRSLAVLPFANLSGDPAQEYFSDGITDSLITDLAQISSVRVISRTSTIRYKKTDKPLPDIARELHVDGIVEGTVERSGDRVRITAQLIHAPLDKHLWANRYERDVRDVFLLERDVTDDIAHQVKAQIGAGVESAGQPQALDRKVLDEYLQGNYHLHMANTARPDDEMRRAGQFFEQAIDAAPAFAPAYVGLAETHHLLWRPSTKDLTVMQASAANALELEPNSPQAHQEMARTKWEEWDWKGAEEEGRRAVALGPNNAEAHDGLGSILAVTGRLQEAWMEFQTAQQLDPNVDHLSYILYLRGEYDHSIEILQRITDERPNDGVTRFYLSQIYAQMGRYDDFVREISKCMTIFGFPEFASRLNRAFATSGWTGAQRERARQVEQLMASRQGYFPAVLGQIYAQLSEKDKAFYWLEEARKHRDLAMVPVIQYVKVDPSFASLHSDPRFKLLLHQMGLPE